MKKPCLLNKDFYKQKAKQLEQRVQQVSTTQYYLLLTACLLMFLLSIKFIGLHHWIYDRILGCGVLALSMLMLVYFIVTYTLK